MRKKVDISLLDMLFCFSEAIELVNQVIKGHNEQVLYATLKLSNQLDLADEKRKQLLIAAALHDIGALYSAGDDEIMRFENSDNKHAEIGYQLIRKFEPFSDVAPLIRYHHHDYSDKKMAYQNNILNVADYISLLIDSEEPILNQVDTLREFFTRNKNKMFAPEVVDAFLEISELESFWFSINSSKIIRKELKEESNLKTIKFDLGDLISFSRLFSQIIDFRSPYTATHTDGVASVGYTLAELMGLSEERCLIIRVAGYLHDLGKLAVPKEILNKKGALTTEEFNVIKGHPFYTYSILDNVDGFSRVKNWAALHHERMDGSGYPFAYSNEEIPLEARIMAVADVFTAITEDRPYRKGMEPKKVIDILKKEAKNNKLDSEVVNILLENYDYLNKLRVFGQEDEAKFYNQFRSSLDLNSNRDDL